MLPRIDVNETASSFLLHAIIDTFCSKRDAGIINGDTNCDFKDSKNTNAKKLRLVYSKYHIEQMINDHTRIATTTTETGEKKQAKHS